VTSNQGCTTGI